MRLRGNDRQMLAYKGECPYFILIESNAGHGGGKPLDKAFNEVVDIFSFTFFNMGVKPKY